MRRWRALVAALVAAGAVAACSEKISAPADCPALCPGGKVETRDTVITALAGLDSTYNGFLFADSVPSMPVTNGAPVLDSRAILRFAPRPDSVTAGGVKGTYTIDSIALNVVLLARDTLLKPINLVVYRLPATTGPGIAFADVQPYLVESNVLARMPVLDTLKAGAIRAVFTGSDLDKFAFAPADSGTLAVAVGVEAAVPTGVRIAGLRAPVGVPSFVTYAKVTAAPAASQAQTITESLQFSTYVFQPLPVPPANALVVGGAPSSRAIIRFALPSSIRDSGTIVRATLELVPLQPILGLSNEPTQLVVRPVNADLGAKSPLDPVNIVGTSIPNGQVDTVRAEMASVVRLWQGLTARPSTVFLTVSPEAASFGRPVFGSSATGATPRLRITYLRPFKFENP